MKLENVKELISIVEDRCDLEQYEGDLGILVKLAKEELEDMSKDTERLSWVSEKQWSGNAIHDAIHWDGRFIRDAIDAAILSDNVARTRAKGVEWRDWLGIHFGQY